MAAYSANLRGASEVYVVDRVPERLQKAKEIGCIPIDFSVSDPAEQIKKLRGGWDAVIHDSQNKLNIVLMFSKEVDRGVDGMPLLLSSTILV